MKTNPKFSFFFLILTFCSLSLAQREQEGPPEPSITSNSQPSYTNRQSLDPNHSLEPHYYQNGSRIPTQYHHLKDHEPLVTERYGQTFTTRIWRCDFRYNDCFLKNRVKWAPFRVTSNFAGAPQSLVLDIGTAARALHGYIPGRPKPIHGYSGSRLTSNGYFPARYVDGCMSLSFYWSGAGRKSLKVLQINEETACIYADEFGSSDLTVQHQGQWKDIQLQLDLRYGHAQYVFEFQFDAPEQKFIQEINSQRPGFRFDYSQLGSIAIKDFSIGYGRCSQRDEANECDVPETSDRLNQQGSAQPSQPSQPEPGQTNYYPSGNGGGGYYPTNTGDRIRVGS